MTSEAYHAAIWAEIDAQAERLGKSASGLAMACGMDKTAFNPSKRGKRLPNMATILAVCHVAGISLASFCGSAETRSISLRRAG